MYLFLCSLFPIGFFIWHRTQGTANSYGSLRAGFAGLFSAAFFCACVFFISPFYYLTQDSFVMNFLHILFNFALMPIALLTILFFIFRKRKSDVARVQNLFPLYAGFYSVYMPFRILCDRPPFPFFLLFVKPIFYFFMTLIVWKIFFAISEGKKTGKVHFLKKTILFYVLIFVLLTPCAIESLWIIGTNDFIVAFSSVVFLFVCVIALLCIKTKSTFTS